MRNIDVRSKVWDSADTFIALGVVYAHQLGKITEWVTSNGDILEGNENDYLVASDTDPDFNEPWTVKNDIFDGTYEYIGEVEHVDKNGHSAWLRKYRKVASVKAFQVHTECKVDTLEGMATAKPTDWILRGNGDDVWPVDNLVFRSRYRLV